MNTKIDMSVVADYKGRFASKVVITRSIFQGTITIFSDGNAKYESRHLSIAKAIATVKEVPFVWHNSQNATDRNGEVLISKSRIISILEKSV
ncbi:MAG: hypothetical protein ACRCYY_12955 [Trueperaceae bacterium]